MPGDSKSKKKKTEENKSEKSKSKSKDKSKQKSSKSPSKAGDKQSKGKKDISKVKKKKQNQSDVSSIIPTAPPAADCIHHKNPFIYYCETCEELICNQCTVYGPHNNHLHRILKITDAYRSRVFYLSEAIRTNLVDKRDKIIAQLHRLEYRSEEIRFVKNIISRDIRSEYVGMLQRLKNIEGIKIASLGHQVSLVQRELDTINDLGNNFFQLTTLDGETLEQQRKLCQFLMKSKKMYEAIQYILSRTQRQLPEIKTGQLPREVEETRSNIQKAIAAKQINDFKNQVIFNLENDLREEQIKVKEQVEEKADYLIRQLSNEAENLNTKLSEFKLICYYCGVRMSQGVVNQLCQINKQKNSEEYEKHATKKTPSQNYNGNGRHFFSFKVIEEEH